jgi:predicted transposase YbfD/YdcC
LVALGLLLGRLLGRTSLAGIARLGRQYGVSLAHALGFRRGKTPSTSTLSRTLRKVDPDHLEDALGRWVRGRIDLAAIEHLCIDGETLRGSRDGDLPGQHLLAAYAPAVRAVLAQIRVDATTNEHKAALRLLGLLPVAGKVVIGDAIFCQRDLAEKVVDSGGDSVRTAKDNQPGLEADVKAGFGFETAARSIAAATSSSASAATAGGTDGHHG